LCSVTSRPAKYKDPLTDLPYATPGAFKLIREKYTEFLRKKGIDYGNVED
uniref:YL1_C domain-containing protein n=1 Tax=Gongylonema pulchrum TaxID=637853 RepID=A0A183EJ95_9BILA